MDTGGVAEAVAPFRVSGNWLGEGQNFFVALSFANLCFLNVWAEIQNPAQYYFLSSTPAEVVQTSLLAVCLLAAGLYAAGWAVRLLVPARFHLLLGLLLLLYPAKCIVVRFQGSTWDFFRAHYVMAFALSCFVGFVSFRWPQRVARIVKTALLSGIVLLPIFAGVSTWRLLAAFRGISEPGPLSPPSGPAASRRVVWMLFDDLDQTLAFPERPSGVDLTELDRWREESFYATSASSPAHFTILSIPSLIAGRVVTDARPTGPSRLRVRFRDTGTTEDWGATSSVFSQAHQLGFRSAIVGWYHPYSRLFGKVADFTFWRQCACATPFLLTDTYDESRGLWEGAFNLLMRQTAFFPLAQRFGVVRAGEGTMPEWKAAREHQVVDYQQIHEMAIRCARDPHFELVFIHWPVPHPPGIFDRSTGRLSAGGRTNYIENLHLVDVSLHDIRQALEQSGLWDRTNVLISADHPSNRSFWETEFSDWDQEELRALRRTRSTNVPFVLKLAGQHEGLTYDKPFNTVVTRELILQLLQGQLTTPEQIRKYLDAT